MENSANGNDVKRLIKILFNAIKLVQLKFLVSAFSQHRRTVKMSRLGINKHCRRKEVSLQVEKSNSCANIHSRISSLLISISRRKTIWCETLDEVAQHLAIVFIRSHTAMDIFGDPLKSHSQYFIKKAISIYGSTFRSHILRNSHENTIIEQIMS